MRALSIRPRMRPRMAPRKDAGVLAENDAHHIASAYVYGTLCSSKKLAYAWKILPATARKYRLGMIVGALTRILWEVVLLERQGIRTTAMWSLIRRAALRERRIQADRSARKAA